VEKLNTLRDAAAPYTHWVMGHRNGVILGLSIILVFETLAFIIYRWRFQKLSLDLEDALKRLAAPATRPTYVAATTRPQGELPAIKGGMTYARNLGSALERAYGPPPAPSPTPLTTPLYRDPATGIPGPWPRPPASGPFSNTPPNYAQPSQPYPIVEPLPAPAIYPTAPAPAAAPYRPPVPAPAPYQPQPHTAPYYPPPPAPAAATAYSPPAPVAPSIEPPPPSPAVAEPPEAETPISVVGKKATDRLKRWLPKVRIRTTEPAAEPAAPSAPEEAPQETASSSSAPVEAEAPSVDEAPLPVPAHAEAEAAFAPAPEVLRAAAPEPLPVLAAEPAPESPEVEPAIEPITWPAEPEAILSEAAAEESSPAFDAAPPAPLEAPPEGASLPAGAPEELAEVAAAPGEASSEAAVEEPVTGDGTPGGDELSATDSAKTILLIEDDEKVAQYYTMLFEARGYRVSIANDGVAGVDLATRLRPGLILLDVMMPRQNGMMVLQTLRATPVTEETPIVILSNFTEPTLIQRALQLGAVEYVVKTQVKAEALANAVPKWMQREKAFA
jgi:CheY-like chemotaxis protein